MKPLQVKEILSYKQTGQVEERSLLNTIQGHIKEKAFVYAVMDHAVALGLYGGGGIQIGLGPEKKAADLPLAYVQELRVFNAQKELRALRCADGFRWRVREDQCVEQGGNIWHLDEKHKLWGSVQKEEDTGEWSLLREKRGSAILFPAKLELQAEKALIVRNYIVFLRAKEENGVVHFIDERLCGFANWPDDKKEGERNGAV